MMYGDPAPPPGFMPDDAPPPPPGFALDDHPQAMRGVPRTIPTRHMGGLELGLGSGQPLAPPDADTQAMMDMHRPATAAASARPKPRYQLPPTSGASTALTSQFARQPDAPAAPEPYQDHDAPYGMNDMITGQPNAGLSPGAQLAYAQAQKAAKDDFMFQAEPKWMQGFSEHLGNGMIGGGAGTVAGWMGQGSQAIKNAVGGAFGYKPEFSADDAYMGYKKAQQDLMRGYDGNPVANGAGEIVGAVESPFLKAAGRLVGAPSIAGKIAPAGSRIAKTLGGVEQAAKSAAVGAGYGGWSGASDAAPGDEAGGALRGAETGALIGAVAPPLLSAGARITAPLRQGLQNAAADLAPKLGVPQRFIPSRVPTAPAAMSALAPTMTGDAATMHPPTFVPQMKAGVLPVAAGNPVIAQLGEKVANSAGPGGLQLRQAIADRMDTEPDRMVQAVQQHLGVDPESARSGVEDLVQQGRDRAAPLYDAIRAQPGPVWNTDLARLAQRPAIKKAMGVVANDMLNAGEDPAIAGIKLDPDTGLGSLTSVDGALDTAQLPTAKTWDNVYKAMGRTVDRHPLTNAPQPDSVSPHNYGNRIATKDLRAALAGDGSTSGAIAGYGDALATSGDYLSTQNAYSRAKGKLFTGTPRDLQDVFASYKTPSEAQAGRAAIANDIMELYNKDQLKPGKFSTPGVQQKLKTVFGDGADDFIANMEQAAQERATYGQITGNSRTQLRQSLEQLYQPKKGPLDVSNLMEWGGAIGAAAHGGPAGPLVLGGKLIKSAANKAAKAKAAPWDTPGMNEELGRVLSDPQAMSDYLDQHEAFQQAQAAAKAGRSNVGKYAPRVVVPLLAAQNK